VMPRLVQTTGFEVGSGLYANPVLPEDAARMLRPGAPRGDDEEGVLPG